MTHLRDTRRSNMSSPGIRKRFCKIRFQWAFTRTGVSDPTRYTAGLLENRNFPKPSLKPRCFLNLLHFNLPCLWSWASREHILPVGCLKVAKLLTLVPNHTPTAEPKLSGQKEFRKMSQKTDKPKSPEAWIRVLALSFMCHMTLAKSLQLPGPSSSKMQTVNYPCRIL